MMEILKAILDNVEADAPVEKVMRGIHWTAVISRFCGLASTIMGESCSHEKETVFPSFSEVTARELARLSLSQDILDASLGVAAINSLIRPEISKCVEINAADLLMRMGKGKNISVIGHFPFTEDLRGAAKNLWVIEKRMHPGDYAEEEAERLLPESDVIAISATTLINHTLERLLSFCPERSIKMLLGPTTPMSEVLFDYGIDVISGSMVIDAEIALKSISEGANFIELKKTGSVKLISMVKDASLLYREVVEA